MGWFREGLWPEYSLVLSECTSYLLESFPFRRLGMQLLFYYSTALLLSCFVSPVFEAEIEGNGASDDSNGTSEAHPASKLPGNHSDLIPFYIYQDEHNQQWVNPDGTPHNKNDTISADELEAAQKETTKAAEIEKPAVENTEEAPEGNEPTTQLPKDQGQASPNETKPENNEIQNIEKTANKKSETVGETEKIPAHSPDIPKEEPKAPEKVQNTEEPQGSGSHGLSGSSPQVAQESAEAAASPAETTINGSQQAEFNNDAIKNPGEALNHLAPGHQAANNHSSHILEADYLEMALANETKGGNGNFKNHEKIDAQNLVEHKVTTVKPEKEEGRQLKKPDNDRSTTKEVPSADKDELHPQNITNSEIDMYLFGDGQEIIPGEKEHAINITNDIKNSANETKVKKTDAGTSEAHPASKLPGNHSDLIPFYIYQDEHNQQWVNPDGTPHNENDTISAAELEAHLRASTTVSNTEKPPVENTEVTPDEKEPTTQNPKEQGQASPNDKGPENNGKNTNKESETAGDSEKTSTHTSNIPLEEPQKPKETQNTKEPQESERKEPNGSSPQLPPVAMNISQSSMQTELNNDTKKNPGEVVNQLSPKHQTVNNHSNSSTTSHALEAEYLEMALTNVTKGGNGTHHVSIDEKNLVENRATTAKPDQEQRRPDNDRNTTNPIEDTVKNGSPSIDKNLLHLQNTTNSEIDVALFENNKPVQEPGGKDSSKLEEGQKTQKPPQNESADGVTDESRKHPTAVNQDAVSQAHSQNSTNFEIKMPLFEDIKPSQEKIPGDKEHANNSTDDRNNTAQHGNSVSAEIDGQILVVENKASTAKPEETDQQTPKLQENNSENTAQETLNKRPPLANQSEPHETQNLINSASNETLFELDKKPSQQNDGKDPLKSKEEGHKNPGPDEAYSIINSTNKQNKGDASVDQDVFLLQNSTTSPKNEDQKNKPGQRKEPTEIDSITTGERNNSATGNFAQTEVDVQKPLKQWTTTPKPEEGKQKPEPDQVHNTTNTIQVAINDQDLFPHSQNSTNFEIKMPLFEDIKPSQEKIPGDKEHANNSTDDRNNTAQHGNSVSAEIDGQILVVENKASTAKPEETDQQTPKLQENNSENTAQETLNKRPPLANQSEPHETQNLINSANNETLFELDKKPSQQNDGKDPLKSKEEGHKNPGPDEAYSIINSTNKQNKGDASVDQDVFLLQNSTTSPKNEDQKNKPGQRKEPTEIDSITTGERNNSATGNFAQTEVDVQKPIKQWTTTPKPEEGKQKPEPDQVHNTTNTIQVVINDQDLFPHSQNSKNSDLDEIQFEDKNPGKQKTSMGKQHVNNITNDINNNKQSGFSGLAAETASSGSAGTVPNIDSGSPSSTDINSPSSQKATDLTTATSTPSPTVCENSSPVCAYITKVACRILPGKYQNICKKTCNNCHGKNCFDNKYKLCPKIKENCNTPKVVDYCPKTCGKCGVKDPFRLI